MTFIDQALLDAVERIAREAGDTIYECVRARVQHRRKKIKAR